MQVTSLPTAALIRNSYDLASLLLLPALSSLAKPSPQTEQLRQELQETDQKKRPTEPRYHAAAASLTPDSPTAALVQAERRMAPGSAAARRDQLQQATAESDGRRQAFQRDLAAARIRERPPGSAPSAAPASRGSIATVEPTAPRGAPTTAQPASPPTNGNGSPSAAAETSPAKPALELRPTNAGPQAPVGRSSPAPATGLLNGGLTLAPTATAAQKSNGQSSAATAPASRTSPSGPTWSATGGAATARTPSSTITGRAAGAAIHTRSPDINLEQILRVVRSHITGQRAQTTLRLDPPELGTIRLHLDLREEALSLRIQTQTELAYRLLSEHSELLRQGLASSGITLTNLEISPPAAANQADAFGLTPQNPDGQSGSKASADADAERSSPEGRDAPDADPAPPAVRDEVEPAAESLVNLWA